jgi:hypothetical protein
VSVAIVAARIVRGIISLTWFVDVFIEFLDILPTGTSVEAELEVDPSELNSAGSIVFCRKGKLGILVAANVALAMDSSNSSFCSYKPASMFAKASPEESKTSIYQNNCL